MPFEDACLNDKPYLSIHMRTCSVQADGWGFDFFLAVRRLPPRYGRFRVFFDRFIYTLTGEKIRLYSNELRGDYVSRTDRDNRRLTLQGLRKQRRHRQFCNGLDRIHWCRFFPNSFSARVDRFIGEFGLGWYQRADRINRGNGGFRRAIS